MILRYYQKAALDAIYCHLREKQTNPCVVMPTGSGKGVLAPHLCNDIETQWGGRVLVMAHVKELIKQLSETTSRLFPTLDAGIYHVGLKKRNTKNRIIFGGIQSIYKRAELFGKFDVIIIDEVHCVPPAGEGRYREFLKASHEINPNVKIIGLTATPYRMTTGNICGPDNILNEICYEIGIKELIEKGYLCNIRAKSGQDKIDTSKLHVRGGEYMAGEVAELMDREILVKNAVREILHLTKDRRGVLIFATSIEHGKHIQSEIIRQGEPCEMVTGNTPTAKRDKMIIDFKAMRQKYLVNINVLTTGFDAPHVDCIAMLRPTLSPGLFYQMTGRGFRICEGKKDCLILDFANNVRTHGPVDILNPVGIKSGGKEKGEAPHKMCGNCNEWVHAAEKVCPECANPFPERKIKHERTAGTLSILSKAVKTHKVLDVRYSKHIKIGKPPSLRVDYQIGFMHFISEYVCIEHKGYTQTKAKAWWHARTLAPFPGDIETALKRVEGYQFKKTSTITVEKDGNFDNIVSAHLMPLNDLRRTITRMNLTVDDLPF